MFTGIVRELGRVAAAEGGAEGVRLVLDAPLTAAGSEVGDSVSVNGCCLTAEAVESGAMQAKPCGMPFPLTGGSGRIRNETATTSDPVGPFGARFRKKLGRSARAPLNQLRAPPPLSAGPHPAGSG